MTPALVLAAASQNSRLVAARARRHGESVRRLETAHEAPLLCLLLFVDQVQASREAALSALQRRLPMLVSRLAEAARHSCLLAACASMAKCV